MTTIRFTHMEIQELKLWAKTHKEQQELTGVKWDEQQQAIIKKLDKSGAKK